MITLEQVKHQCRIEHDDEDGLLTGYIDAAKAYAAAWIDGELDEANPAQQQALLLLIGHWYENREAVNNDYQAPAPIPHGFDAIMQRYRKMGV